MYFLLNTPQSNNVQSNTTKVKVHLKNGIAEILNLHSDLLGRVDNNIVEIETNFENKIQKSLFVVQNAVFIVSNKGLDKKLEDNTSVYVYAKDAREINSSLVIDEIVKQYEIKNGLLENEKLKLKELPFESDDKKREKLESPIKSRIFKFNEEVEFFQKVLTISKASK